VLNSAHSIAESGTQMNGVDAYPRFEKGKESDWGRSLNAVSAGTVRHNTSQCQCWHSGDRCDGEFLAGPGEKAMAWQSQERLQNQKTSKNTNNLCITLYNL